jgi:BirA family transcriptional regulator, biotin operon repressor / biotin---[acetyl-CoA-carboxylase] ligase
LDPVDRLVPARITRRLSSRRFGRRIYYYPETDSTNRVAVELIRRGEPDGCLVVADFQTAGRGRLDRVWNSPPGKDLLFTLILRPGETVGNVLPVTLVLALAAASSLSEYLGADVGVKWPNDVVTAGGKIGGILAEKPSIPDTSAALAVGIGINVNSLENDFPPEYRGRAASCATQTSVFRDRAEVLAELLVAMEDLYDRFCKNGFAPLRPLYEDRLFIRGRPVTFERTGTQHSGLVEGVENDGALRVKTGSPDSAICLLYGEEVISLP